MAVEASHMNSFPSQILSDRDLIKTNQAIHYQYNTQMESAIPFYSPMQEPLLPYSDSIRAKTSMNKADSGLTYNINAHAPRKRPRDSINDFDAYNRSFQKTKVSALSSFVDEDVIFQLQQQQSDIDRLIVAHTEKVKLEVEERSKRQSRLLFGAIQEEVTKKMKEKDEEIERMGKLNWVLQERVKSLYVENQIWRDMAQSNEATANSLRSNLEQVLAHVGDEKRHQQVSGGGGEDDAESSCCGSSDYGRQEEEEEGLGQRGMIAGDGVEGAQDKEPVAGGGGRMCKKCGERESIVLLLPCRHLCLCTMCGSTLLRTCPVCDSVMTGSVHVNMS
ncbi:zf-C3HC4_3 domain-containing protein [Cephalotus follicularis]|uniref:RING-type E3 ubiquitin transferase n=1 Tax=Cephalotus follicularis TaxID=3775 RepID=A0A1Q3B930_CEPFO|nr:zf-C3HC4_3 domain-containing protein [Cephalotus follicularis]